MVYKTPYHNKIQIPDYNRLRCFTTSMSKSSSLYQLTKGWQCQATDSTATHLLDLLNILYRIPNNTKLIKYTQINLGTVYENGDPNMVKCEVDPT
jgi:hypothetical protein